MNSSGDHTRRRFLRAVATTMATGPVTMLGRVGARVPPHLAALERGQAWLNTRPLTAAELRGKVVVVDFCTYTCINWLRSLPYRRAWALKYADRLVFIGVHTPEFAFEHDLENVRREVRRLNVGYPIVLDNDYAIWRAFDNHYWPALYVVDAGGRVRDRQFGEGEYHQSEQVIQRLLAEAEARSASRDLVMVAGTGAEAAADWNALGSPETYLGYEGAESFSSPGGAKKDRQSRYALPARLGSNRWALAGDWTIGRQSVVLGGASGRIACRFRARDLHLVMGPSSVGRPIRIRVILDGHSPGTARGVDIDAEGAGIVEAPRLYQLIRQPGSIGDRVFEIEFLDAGGEAYAFTFG